MSNKSRKTKNHGAKNQKANGKTPKDHSEVHKSESTLFSENNNESTTCNAVLLTKSKIGDEKDMIEDAKLELGRALRDEDLYFQDMRGEPFVGNHGGLNLAQLALDVRAVNDELTSQKAKFEDKFTGLETKCTGLETKCTGLETKCTGLETKCDALSNRLLAVTSLQNEYSQVRNRFISVFKRDKLSTVNRYDYKIIDDGNIVAHEGDAFADAALYPSLHQRSDRDTFVKLYGLSPEVVSRMS